MALETVVSANLSNNRKAPAVMLAMRGTDGESYMLRFDETSGTASVPGTLTAPDGSTYVASFSFLRDGVATQAVFDTVTPTNNRGVPVLALAGDSAEPLAVGAGNISATTQRVAVATDQWLFIESIDQNVFDIETELLAQGITLDSIETISSQIKTNTDEIETELIDHGLSLDSINQNIADIEAETLAQGISLDSIDASTASIDTKLKTGSQTTANSVAVSLPSDYVATASRYSKARDPLYRDYSLNSINGAGYTEILSSVGATAVQKLHIFDSSGEAIWLAIGGVGAEVDHFIIPPGGIDIVITIPAGSRLSLKNTVNATISTGILTINFLG